MSNIYIHERIRKFLYSYSVTKYLCEIRLKVKFFVKKVIPIYINKWKDKKIIFYVLTPEHGNLGDHAIALSMKLYLEENKINYYEITYDSLYSLSNYGFLNSLNNRRILVNGGGNLGTLWFGVEQLFRELIVKNPDSKIVCLPNTIYYENTETGYEELQKSIEIYNAHKKLTICARETISYDFMKKIYNNVVLIPDMVLALNYSEAAGNVRHGCLLCLRNDIERTLSSDKEKSVIANIEKIGLNITKTDMIRDYRISIENRKTEVEKKITEFKKSEIVVTDRLHGMIFAAISGTPCIVLDSKSPKLRGCYNWIKDLGYIKFANTPEEIPVLYSMVIHSNHIYNNSSLKPYYDLLKNIILQ